MVAELLEIEGVPRPTSRTKRWKSLIVSSIPWPPETSAETSAEAVENWCRPFVTRTT
jgi:hypothetical protein